MKPFQLFWTITRKFYRKSCFMIFDQSKITFDRLSAIFDRLIRNWAAIEISINSEIIFLSFSIDWAKDSTDQKCHISNSHLENSRTWILTLWNNILQTQISLLQHIHVYTYIYNKFDMCIKSVMNMQFNGYIFKKYSNINDIE